VNLQLCTWQEVEHYLEKSKGIIIPIGSTEQHGPNGLIGTDAITAEKIASVISEQHNIMVAPTINYGMAQHHLGFAGSISLRPTTLISIVVDIVSSVAKHGFTHIFFLNGHGGNIAPLKVAFSEIYADYSFNSKPCPFICSVGNWFDGKGISKLSRDLYNDVEGQHATPSEVALTYYMHPECVKEVDMSPKVAPLGDIRDALNYRSQFPDGRIGSDPSLATVEAGEKICKAAVLDVYNKYRLFLDKS
jgi:creatinine amidohydrolase